MAPNWISHPCFEVGELMHRLKSNMAAQTKDFSEEGVLTSDKITIWGVLFEQQLFLFFFFCLKR
jgi:hypothetical protein